MTRIESVKDRRQAQPNVNEEDNKKIFFAREERLEIFPWELKIDEKDAWEMLCNPKRGRGSTV